MTSPMFDPQNTFPSPSPPKRDVTPPPSSHRADLSPLRIFDNVSGVELRVLCSPCYPFEATGTLIAANSRVYVRRCVVASVEGRSIAFWKLARAPGWVVECEPFVPLNAPSLIEVTSTVVDAEYVRNQEWRSPPTWHERQKMGAAARAAATFSPTRRSSAHTFSPSTTPDSSLARTLERMESDGRGLAARLEARWAAKKRAEVERRGAAQEAAKLAADIAAAEIAATRKAKEAEQRHIEAAAAAARRAEADAANVDAAKKRAAAKATEAEKAKTRRATAAAVRDLVSCMGRRAAELQSGVAALEELTAALETGYNAFTAHLGADLDFNAFTSCLRSYVTARIPQHELRTATTQCIFDAIDVDENGALSMAELTCAFATMFRLNATEASSVMFDACDGVEHRDGALQQREFTVLFRCIVAVNALLSPDTSAHLNAHEVGAAQASQMFAEISRGTGGATAMLRGIVKAQFCAWFVRTFGTAAEIAAAASASNDVARTSSLPGEVPLDGLRLADLVELATTARNGRRVMWSGTSVGTAVEGKNDGVLYEGARTIAAAVGDLVTVQRGISPEAAAQAGRIGKVTAFVPGASDDGSLDVFVVESLAARDADARLLGVASLGWSAAGWPANYLAAEARPTTVRLELHAGEFTRFAEYLSVTAAAAMIIAPRIADRECSYCELLEDSGVAPRAVATHLVSFAMSYSLSAVVETLQEWYDRPSTAASTTPSANSESARFWFAPASLNPTAGSTDQRTPKWFANFAIAAKTIGHTLPIVMPWRDSLWKQRTWCLYELHTTLQAGGDVTFLVSSADRAVLGLELVSEIKAVVGELKRIDIADAACAELADHTALTSLLSTTKGGARNANKFIYEALFDWITKLGLERIERRDASGAGNAAETLKFVSKLGRELKHHDVMDPRVERLYRRAVAGYEAVGGPSDENTMKDQLKAKLRLAELLQGQGHESAKNTREAKKLLRCVAEGRETLFGATHIDTLQVKESLADLLLNREDDLEGSEVVRLEIIAALQKSLHVETITVQNERELREKLCENQTKLVTLLTKQGESLQAVTLMQTVAKAHSKLRGKKDPIVLRDRIRVAEMFKDLGRASEAEPIMRSVLRSYEATLGADAAETLDAVLLLGKTVLLSETIPNDESVSLFARVATGRAQLFGASDPQTKEAEAWQTKASRSLQ